MIVPPQIPPLRFATVTFGEYSASAKSMHGLGVDCSEEVVAESIYRGAYPKKRNLCFLQSLKLHTVLSLTPKPLDINADSLAWTDNSDEVHEVRLVHIRTEKPDNESGGLSREGAVRALLAMMHRKNLPMYIHCLDGIEATSALVGCLRELQGWAEPAILEELARGTHTETNSLTGLPVHPPDYLEQFVTRFGASEVLQLPCLSQLPSWLWGSATRRHVERAQERNRAKGKMQPLVQAGKMKVRLAPESEAAASLRRSRSLLRKRLPDASPQSSTVPPSLESATQLQHDASADYKLFGRSDTGDDGPQLGGGSSFTPDVANRNGSRDTNDEDGNERTPRARPTLVEGQVPPLQLESASARKHESLNLANIHLPDTLLGDIREWEDKNSDDDKTPLARGAVRQSERKPSAAPAASTTSSRPPPPPGYLESFNKDPFAIGSVVSNDGNNGNNDGGGDDDDRNDNNDHDEDEDDDDDDDEDGDLYYDDDDNDDNDDDLDETLDNNLAIEALNLEGY